MTDEERYQRLIQTAAAERKLWLLSELPADVPPALRWISLVEMAVFDALRTLDGRSSRSERRRADVELASGLLEWALEDGFPAEHAIERLAHLAKAAMNAGLSVEALPPSLRPDHVLRLTLERLPMTRDYALSRAATLRSIPLTEDDFYKPGEDPAIFRSLTQTADYRDYHRLLNTRRMLAAIAPLVDSATDAQVAAELRLWLAADEDLDPVPADIPTFPGPQQET